MADTIETPPGDAESAAAGRSRPRVRWRRLRVAGRAAACLEAGEGRTVVFLHGWGLSHRAYRDAVRGLAASGVRVLAPALPGFSGTAALPADEANLEGYAAWVAAFLDEMEISEPAMLVGHSFGGGVGIVTAHDHPSRVGALVLVNAIGGATWTRDGELVTAMADRPWWNWGLHFSADLGGPIQLAKVLPVVFSEALPNLVLDPRAFVHAARLARDADLTTELEVLHRRGLPVVVVWSPRDRIVTEASVEALCEALGDAPTISVPGGHNWLLADPVHFGEVMTNVVQVAERARWLAPGRTRRWLRRVRRSKVSV
ncbi:MAG TPA: alpha/beta fold hydrolase [Acidimicrobiia bacterium]|nr:alpha/beta fold hydrolase [Acidimicrobiia bacterium]